MDKFSLQEEKERIIRSYTNQKPNKNECKKIEPLVNPPHIAKLEKLLNLLKC